MIEDAIAKVVRGENLVDHEMQGAMEMVLDNRATPAQMGAFMAGLRIKGETVAEIAAAARVVRARGQRLQVDNGLVNLDRDEINVEEETIRETRTFNISTATAFVTSGGGVPVAKHGSRAVSSRCGSADVLSNLGVRLDLNRSSVEDCIQEVGIGFLYTPLFQGALRHTAAPRREVGIRSIFNLLGPLVNPARAKAQVLGVYRPEMTEIMARVLGELDCREAFVVCGHTTRDEISICGPTRISHLKGKEVRTFRMEPGDFGFRPAEPGTLRGGNARENACIVRDVLEGKPGAPRDVVVMNAAAAFVAAGKETDFRAGADRAKDAIDSGRARDKLERLIRYTQDCRPFVRGEIVAA